MYDFDEKPMYASMCTFQEKDILKSQAVFFDLRVLVKKEKIVPPPR